MSKTLAKIKKQLGENPLFSKPKVRVPVVATKVVLKPALVMNSTIYPYGRFGLVNFTESETAQHTDNDILRFVNLPPTKLDMKTVVEGQRNNMFQIYRSDWRLMYQKGDRIPGVVINAEINDLAIPQRVEAIYIEDYIAGFREHESMWLKNYEKIFESLSYEFDRAARNFRGCRSVLALSRKTTFKLEYAKLIMSMWDHFEIPMKKNYAINFRFYLFTSSIPGTKASEKLAFLNKLPKEFMRILCLVADDINMKQLTVLVKQTNARGTFVPTEVKDSEGKLIKGDYKPYLEMLGVHKLMGGSYSPPPIFIPEKQLTEKIMKYYSRATNVILF